MNFSDPGQASGRKLLQYMSAELRHEEDDMLQALSKKEAAKGQTMLTQDTRGIDEFVLLVTIALRHSFLRFPQI